jgi:hypothetical protein
MNSSELEALAAELYAEIARSLGDSESAEIELKDVKDWIAFRKKEDESCPEPPFFLNLL